MAGPRPYPEVQQGLEEKISPRKQRKSKEKHLPRNYTEEETHRFSSFVFYRGYFLFYQPLIIVLHFVCELSGSILCSLFLWIPAYAGMTGESLRNPVPELVEGAPAFCHPRVGGDPFFAFLPCFSVFVRG